MGKMAANYFSERLLETTEVAHAFINAAMTLPRAGPAADLPVKTPARNRIRKERK